MWITAETEIDIQVLPYGEEDYHSWDNTCECFPKVSLDTQGKMVIVHNAFDARELFERAYETPLHTIRQEIDC